MKKLILILVLSICHSCDFAESILLNNQGMEKYENGLYVEAIDLLINQLILIHQMV